MLSVLTCRHTCCWMDRLRPVLRIQPFPSIRRLHCSKIASNLSPVRCQSSNVAKTFAKDVVIYRNENPRHYRYITLFGVAQFIGWMFLSNTVYSLRNIPPLKDNQHLPFYMRFDWTTLRIPVTIMSFVLAIVAGFGCVFYTSRSIRLIVLRKDGRTIRLRTYRPLGGSIFEIPVTSISASGSRISKQSSMPLKIKNMRFYYLVDPQGEFPHPLLFDQTIGVRRHVK